MPSNPHLFNQHRKLKNKSWSIVKHNIEEIIQYIIDSYLYMLSQKPKISLSEIKETTTYKFEDYLSGKLVDEYLITRKGEHFSELLLSQLIFTKQSSENYIDHSSKLSQPDLIDIYITNLQLDKYLSSSPQPYFAIECKRIRNSGSFDDYLSDIKKFTNREYSRARLLYEGQIAFIENPNYPPNFVVEKLNEKLQTNQSISTIQTLSSKVIHEGFDGSYYSKHLKNFGEKNVFGIYHLMFDYTKIVVD